MLERAPGWEGRLAAFIDSRRRTPFVWGEHDCALFVADAVQAMTGVDVAVPLRGYASARGALGKLQRFNGGGLTLAMDKLAARHGMAPIPVERAQRGDVLLAAAEEGEAQGGVVLGRGSLEVLALCLGARLVTAGPADLQFAPSTLATRAWTIGWRP